ncbi:hypothetical protein D5086_027161 [Populus alba]|uniref:Uncharacterized protein n=1 Tax=Populus alba TaxID=43335 RepID=A0ACC4B497_POPAL
MAKNKRTTHRTTVQNQQQLQVELHNNSVLALAAPPLPPSPPPLTPSPKAVAGGSSPDKFLFFAEEGAVPQSIVSSPSTPDHVIVEDCFEEEDFEDDEVDYSASGDNPSFFHSPLPPSTRHNVDINPNSASRVSPISESGHSVIPEPSPTKRRSSSVPPLQHISPGHDGVDHNIPNVISSPTEAPHSGAPQSPAPVEKWRDLFATNHSTTTVASGEWEIVKSKKARKTSNIPVRGTLAADHVSTIQLSSKAPAAVSSGDTCNPIIVHEKEPAGAATSRIDPNVVSVGIVNNRGQRRSSSCATGNGSGGRVLPSFTII